MEVQKIKQEIDSLRFEDLTQLKTYIDNKVAFRVQNGDDWTEAPES